MGQGSTEEDQLGPGVVIEVFEWVWLLVLTQLWKGSEGTQFFSGEITAILDDMDTQQQRKQESVLLEKTSTHGLIQGPSNVIINVT